MNNNSIYGNGTITVRGTGATSASVSLGVPTGLSGAGSGVASYTPLPRCRICGHAGIYFSYTSMITVCGVCGCHQDDFNRTDDTEVTSREALNKLTDVMKQTGKVEPVEEDKIKETKLMKYKVGDKVKVDNHTSYSTDVPDEYLIHGIPRSHEENPDAYIADIYHEYYLVNYRNSSGKRMQLAYREYQLTLLEESQTTMLNPLSDLSNLIQRTFSEDTKTLYRAGYLSKDLNITEKLTNAVGEMFVGHIIADDIDKQTFATFAAELIKKAKEEIAEAEKKEKK